MKILALTICLLAQASWVSADLVIAFAPADLTVTSTGADQTIGIDLLVRNDGTTPLDFSGITLNYSVNNPPLTPLAGDRTSDFAFTFGPSQSVIGSDGGSFSASSVGANIPVSNTFQKLGSLQFTLAGSFLGTTPIALTFVNATDGIATNLDSSDFTLPASTQLTVSAIPEPSGFLYGGVVAALLGCVCWIRKRAGNTNK